MSDKDTSIEESKKQKIEKAMSLLEDVSQVLAEYGIDIGAIIEQKREKLLPTIPENFRDDALTVIVKARGPFAISNLGNSHQEDIPDFEVFPCGPDCDEILGPENAYWISLGNMEYLRVICPSCGSKTIPDTIDIKLTARVNMRDPSIRKAAEMAGLLDKEDISDIEEAEEK